MDKIKRVSQIFRILFILLFIVQPILFMVAWVYMPNQLNWFGFGHSAHVLLSTLPKDIHVRVVYPLTWKYKFLGFLIDVIPLILNQCVLYFLIKLFGLYQQGKIFLLQNVNYVRNIGYTLLITQIANPICQALLTLVLTWQNPLGQHYATISLNGTNLGLILMSVLIILISWIMAEGYKLQEEQQYIV